MAEEHYTLCAFWRPRNESAEACATRLAGMLTSLGAIHPAFSRWFNRAYTRKTAYEPFCSMPPDTGILTEKFENNEIVGAWNGADNLYAMSFDIVAGRAARMPVFPNSVMISLPLLEPDNQDLLDANILKAALKAIVTAWAPDWASVDSFAYFRPWLDMNRRFPRFRTGWMTYVSLRYAMRITPPTFVDVERLPGGGILMIASAEPFSVDHPPISLPRTRSRRLWRHWIFWSIARSRGRLDIPLHLALTEPDGRRSPAPRTYRRLLGRDQAGFRRAGGQGSGARLVAWNRCGGAGRAGAGGAGGPGARLALRGDGVGRLL